jgi:SsrA-binding protein
MKKLITKNKKAFFDYEILDTIEAGIILTGDEVKSLRAGQVNLTGAFATVHDGNLTLINCTIATYARAYQKQDDVAQRTRILLVHRKELARIIGEISKKGVTVVPLSLYFNDRNKVKVELGLCKAKKAAGKKQTIKERDIRRETARELKNIRNS